MKINLSTDGMSVSALYIQTLVLLYLPGEKFGENEDASRLDFSLKHENDVFYGEAKLFYEGKTDTKNLCVKKASYPSFVDKAKCFAGQLFLSLFSDFFGYMPPWGMMTGVRPARFALEIMQNGVGARECAEILEKHYMANAEKASLACRLAELDMSLLPSSAGRRYSLYIGIPFCPSRCSYCSFVSYATDGLRKLLPDYISKLSHEVRVMTAIAKSLSLELKSVYIGGGTPSILAEKELEAFLCYVRECVGDGDFEFDFEGGRPDTLTREKLDILKRYGVTRLCINTQTTNDEILRSIGRNHTFDDYKRAYSQAKSAGFCVNTDLIAGLPGESTESFCRSLNEICDLHPENITVHSFSMKKSSEFTVSGQKIMTGDDRVCRMLTYCEEKMRAGGYLPYYMYRQKNTDGNLENVGYTDKIPNAGLYNIYMMEGLHSVFACGAGSSTKLISPDMKVSEKAYNHKYPYEYLNDNNDINKKEELIRKFYGRF